MFWLNEVVGVLGLFCIYVFIEILDVVEVGIFFFCWKYCMFINFYDYF